MKYLDRRAERIARTIRAALIEELHAAGRGDLRVSEPEESIYASESGDRGSMLYVTKVKPQYQDESQRFFPGFPEEPGEDLIADVRVEIPSAKGYGEESGWGFGYGCTLESGRMGPGSVMHNYTESVWTADREEIRFRLARLEDEAEDYAANVAEFLEVRV